MKTKVKLALAGSVTIAAAINKAGMTGHCNGYNKGYLDGYMAGLAWGKAIGRGMERFREHVLVEHQSGRVSTGDVKADQDYATQAQETAQKLTPPSGRPLTDEEYIESAKPPRRRPVRDAPQA
jgi:hypothetical protein